MFNLFKPFDLFKIGSAIASGVIGEFTITFSDSQTITFSDNQTIQYEVN